MSDAKAINIRQIVEHLSCMVLGNGVIADGRLLVTKFKLIMNGRDHIYRSRRVANKTSEDTLCIISIVLVLQEL